MCKRDERAISSDRENFKKKMYFTHLDCASHLYGSSSANNKNSANLALGQRLQGWLSDVSLLQKWKQDFFFHIEVVSSLITYAWSTRGAVFLTDSWLVAPQQSKPMTENVQNFVGILFVALSIGFMCLKSCSSGCFALLFLVLYTLIWNVKGVVLLFFSFSPLKCQWGRVGFLLRPTLHCLDPEWPPFRNSGLGAAEEKRL